MSGNVYVRIQERFCNQQLGTKQAAWVRSWIVSAVHVPRSGQAISQRNLTIVPCDFCLRLTTPQAVTRQRCKISRTSFSLSLLIHCLNTWEAIPAMWPNWIDAVGAVRSSIVSKANTKAKTHQSRFGIRNSPLNHTINHLNHIQHRKVLYCKAVSRAICPEVFKWNVGSWYESKQGRVTRQKIICEPLDSFLAESEVGYTGLIHVWLTGDVIYFISFHSKWAKHSLQCAGDAGAHLSHLHDHVQVMPVRPL